MKSPFPGMDPYLEQHWGDIHHRLVTYACDQLQERLPNDLCARVEERVFLEKHLLVADVPFVKEPHMALPAEPQSDLAVVAEPYRVELIVEPITEGFIEIVDLGSKNKLVSVIEVLSLTNKRSGKGRREYQAKVLSLRRGQVSLVEIDLLRSGRRKELANLTELLRQSRFGAKLRVPYFAKVRRGWDPIPLEIYPLSLREPLPSIRIPLRQTDRDVRLDLQPLIDQCYRNGRYDRIDYTYDPEPPLKGKDARWADELLREAGRRTEAGEPGA